MKKIIILTALIGCSSLFGQSIERQVLGTTGSLATSGTFTVNSTVGEPAITMGSSSTIILTQGYQQSSSSSVSVEENALEVSNLKLFPNPTTNSTTLSIKSNKVNSTVQVQVLSTAGKLIATNRLSLQAGAESTLTIDLNSVSAGVYFVRITEDNSSLSKTLRLVKQ